MILSTDKTITNYNTTIKAVNNRATLDKLHIDNALRELVYWNLYARIERNNVEIYLDAIMAIMKSKGLLK